MTTVQDTVHSQGRSTYDIYFEIDCDCEELLDAIGLDYTRVKEIDALGNQVDSTQNEVLISLEPDEAHDVLDQSLLSMTNEQTIACAVLNHELSEYTTKATIYTPSGDVIMFK
tara:strand:- start:181 stop:519 length:339 start_codon:yes stop_codon:yes gene_type:complete